MLCVGAAWAILEALRAAKGAVSLIASVSLFIYTSVGEVSQNYKVLFLQ